MSEIYGQSILNLQPMGDNRFRLRDTKRIIRYRATNQKKTIAIKVGGIAPSKRPTGLIPVPSKALEDCRIPAPAGFGALAMTVNPPPVTAPATRAYLS
jgi:hypothetical protein